MTLEKTVDDFVNLQRQADKKPLIKLGKKALAAQRSSTASFFEMCKKNGFVETLYDKQKMLGCFALVNNFQTVFPLTPQVCFLAIKKSDKKLLRWLRRVFQRHKNEFDKEKIEIWIKPAFSFLVPHLEKMGFHIETVLLMGKPRKALKQLTQKRIVPSTLNHLGLEIRPIQPKDVAAVIKIFRAEFCRNPQYGWFCGLPDYLNHRAKEFRKNINKSDKAFVRVITNKSGKVVGVFSAVFQDDPVYERRGGTELIFDQSIQGHGISKTAYRLMLEWLVEKNVTVFQGGTSQAPVLKMGRVMKRVPSMYIMRWGKGFFKSSHFLDVP